MARGYGEPVGNEYGADDNNRDRWRDDDRERAGWGGDRDRGDNRGFLERAGDELKSWFSDDDDRGRNRDWERNRSGGGWTSGSSPSSWDRDTSHSPRSQSGWSGGSHSWDRDQNRGGISDRDRERSHGRGGTDYTSQGRGFGSSSGSSWDRDKNRGQSGSFGPTRGGWSESSNRDRSNLGSYGENRGGFGGFRDEDDFRSQQHRRSHPQSWGEANRGENESLGFSDYQGTLGGFGNQTFGSTQDDHYRSWRNRQMEQLDRDYDDYCRERETQFHSDFDSWRKNRQGQGQGQSSPTGQGSNEELILGGSSTSGVAPGTGTATGSPGESSAVGGDSLTSSSPTLSDTGETAGAGSGSGVSGRSRTRS